MTFTEFLKVKKNVKVEEHTLDELMEEYYEEYLDFLMTVKDGCGQS